MDWLAVYEVETDERPWLLGAPATLTVVKRRLSTDERSHAILPVEPCPPGDHQREVILRAMAGRFPDARWKTYNEETQIASFVGRDHLYIVIYEEHDEVGADAQVTSAQPSLFTV